MIIYYRLATSLIKLGDETQGINVLVESISKNAYNWASWMKLNDCVSNYGMVSVLFISRFPLTKKRRTKKEKKKETF